MKLTEASKKTVQSFWLQVFHGIKRCEYLEDASQQLSEALYGEFQDSVVLVRVFVTIPFGDLPVSNQEFVRALAEQLGLGDQLTEATPVLSLTGTSGREADWCDWRLSKGHMGIPLISRESVEQIPMIAQLLKDLGLGLDWLDSTDSESDESVSTYSGGTFFVPDATSGLDSEGRKIIPGQDFVEGYGVKTVFGNGGRYGVGSPHVLAVIFFTNESLSKNIVSHFSSLIYLFKTSSAACVVDGKFYRPN